MNPIDIKSIAETLVKNHPLSSSFLALQTTERRRGIRQTTWKTVQHKLKAIGAFVTRGDSTNILGEMESLGLGTVESKYSNEVIRWNSGVDLLALGRMIREHTKATRNTRADTSCESRLRQTKAEEREVICKIPASLYRVLKDLGIFESLGLKLAS